MYALSSSSKSMGGANEAGVAEVGHTEHNRSAAAACFDPGFGRYFKSMTGPTKASVGVASRKFVQCLIRSCSNTKAGEPKRLFPARVHRLRRFVARAEITHGRKARYSTHRYASPSTCQPCVAHDREPVYNVPSLRLCPAFVRCVFHLFFRSPWQRRR